MVQIGMLIVHALIPCHPCNGTGVKPMSAWPHDARCESCSGTGIDEWGPRDWLAIYPPEDQRF